ncbi:MAG TPA: hypothetical protein P5560_07425 [Thermotogota bacterium]|nr:hypothetical protein [Thermotogota bacterium]HRW92754.1 hypothetical protein [Thermotogota bacterium]
MKRMIVLMAVLFLVMATMGLAQLRLGIRAQDTYNGVMITEVMPGYPAYGYLQPGDIVVAAQIYPNYYPNPIPMGPGGGGVVLMGPMNQQIVIQNYAWNANSIYSMYQLQNIILNAPVNSTLVIWVRRWGVVYSFVIQLMDNWNQGVVMMMQIP